MRTHFCLQLLLGSTLALLLAACGDPLSGGGGNGGGGNGAGGNGAGGNGGGGTTPAPEITFGQDVDVAPQVAAAGGEMTVSFKATADWTAGVTETKAIDWITVQPTGGKAGDVKVTITVKPNEGSEKRAASVVLKSGEVQKTITVSQEAGRLADEDWYGVNFWDRTDLQKNGFRGPVKSFQVTNYEGMNRYEFDERGHLLSVGNRSYRYDDKGRRIRSEYKEDGWVSEVVEYVYGNGDKLVAVDDFWLSDYFDLSRIGSWDDFWNRDMIIRGLSERHEDWIQPDQVSCHDSYYVFGEDGRLNIEYRTYTVAKWEYDEKGREAAHNNEEVTKSVVIYEAGMPVSSRDGQMRFTWRPNGMPATFDSNIPETVYTWYGNQVTTATWLESGRYMSIEFYKVPQGYAGSYMPTVYAKNQFNEYGEIVQRDHMEGDTYSETGAISTDYYTDYVYDAHGNWISRKESVVATFTGQRGETTIQREITYY